MNLPSRIGLFYAFAAYGMWGLVPLYFKNISTVPPREVLAMRVIWAMVVLCVLMTAIGKWPLYRKYLADPLTRRRLLVSTCVVLFNWYVFIYAVMTDRITQTALGYFILPLVNVVLSMVFLHERMRSLQWAAVFMAGIGVVYLIDAQKNLPWIAMTLAVSFALYGLLRKIAGVDGVVGLAVETTFVTPLAVAWAIYTAARGELVFGTEGLQYDALIACAGIVTTAPLICFAEAVRRLKLITIGFIQYLSPSIAFLIGVFHYGEPFGPDQQIAYGLIWAGVLVFLLDGLRGREAKDSL